MVKCNECNTEIRPRVGNMIQHSGSSKGYSSRSKKYTVKIVIACECTSESPQATELDSIKVSGEIPDQWK